MRVSKKNRLNPATKARKKTAPAQSADFSHSLLNLTSTKPSSLKSVLPNHAGVATDQLQGLLGVQEQMDQTHDHLAQSISYGNGLLDKLEELRRLLLEGALKKRDLLALKKLLSEAKNKSDDVRLNGLVREIELRAHVELAKYSKIAR